MMGEVGFYILTLCVPILLLGGGVLILIVLWRKRKRGFASADDVFQLRRGWLVLIAGLLLALISVIMIRRVSYTPPSLFDFASAPLRAFLGF